MQQVTSHLRRMLSLSGCAGREEFLAVLMLTGFAELLVWLFIGAGHVPVPQFPGHYVILFGGKGALAVLLTMAMHYPLFATAVRRCHDTNFPGWYLLFCAVPLPWVGAGPIYAGIGILIGIPPEHPNRYDREPQASVRATAAA